MDRWLAGSLSARRAWIEMLIFGLLMVLNLVALRKESVDRNNTRLANIRACIVALRKESVDRNVSHCLRGTTATSSLSARRAWIEIV